VGEDQVLVEFPSWQYQALITNLAESVALPTLWRNYNQQAGCGKVIKRFLRC
jgi:hypothetical protein